MGLLAGGKGEGGGKLGMVEEPPDGAGECVGVVGGDEERVKAVSEFLGNGGEVDGDNGTAGSEVFVELGVRDDGHAPRGACGEDKDVGLEEEGLDASGVDVAVKDDAVGKV